MLMDKPRLSKVFSSIESCPQPYEGKIPNRFINIKGEQYNNLEVLYLVGFRNKRSEWLCKCHNCNKYVVVNSHNLRTGHTKSCGCLISESLRIDLTGKNFGYLTVLGYDKSIKEHPQWKVRCNNCGKEYSVSGDALKTQKSCGCIMSQGELYIAKILQENNVNFKSQVTFEGLVGKNNNKLRFDFGVYNNNGVLSHLIEMQGIQHYYNIFNIPKEEYEYRLFLDEKKREWCKNNNIFLIEIKYNEKITIEKLLCYHTKGIIFEDFIQYRFPTMFITNTTCNLKCEKECGIQCCSNNKLFKEKNFCSTFDTIINKYMSNPITKSLTFGGLEQFDEPEQLLLLIKSLRKFTQDDIIIYTGYYPNEINNYVKLLSENFNNIIIKFGRYIPNQETHYDEVLGVKLASDNQYAIKYNEK